MMVKRAAVCVIIKDNRVVLVSRPENPEHYGIPGGKVEEDESPREAAIREVEEETGISLNPHTIQNLIIKHVPSRREQNCIYETHCFVTRVTNLQIDGSPEGLNVKLVPPWQIVQPPYAYFNSAVYQALVNDGWVDRN